MDIQSPEDIANEIYNSFVNGKVSRMEGWDIGMNPHNIAYNKDLWLGWRAGWETIDIERKKVKDKLLNFKSKNHRFIV